MNLNISGHHLEVTPAIREYVSGKIERTTRHFDNVIDVLVILSVDKLEHKAEATINVVGKDLHVESIDSDMYAAIDSMVDKLDRQIIKYKEKLSGHRNDALKHQVVIEE
ncbi:MULTISPECIES: ribosome hibernation-promoting factor, HPF/YfiA family [Deefgea]|uniref:Ribosome hibernation promoting factor n=2 Tax=Deefgea TaxID=400947 RepID=A0A6M8SMU0_9NEIS|nr:MULTISPECIES: ribosome-associated translation inhibitor RaiA [Deefgea]MBM5573508.1 ribosome-associated translation inhibitor RaiA [Deefgea sp. CFH1-16]MCB5196082.1 ribosome-associated translation inhibitor RaiA [Deefgea salmonis]QKJ65538.1 ribosome-associated translation inhibitor RaiA [Deefgea piscis]QZA80518.1 ribosome-associated translation inhibitor RaiA [Deefgea piscis]